MNDFYFKQLEAKVDSLIHTGKIFQHKATPSNNLYSVEVSCDFITDFLPTLSLLAGNTNIHNPFSIGESVLIIARDGDINNGIIIGSLNDDDNPAPSSDLNQYITQYSDGTIIKYNAASHTLNIDCQGDINIITPSSVNLNASSVTIDSGSIDLGTSGTGVITCESTCPFTGNPHFDGSTNTRSKK